MGKTTIHTVGGLLSLTNKPDAPPGQHYDRRAVIRIDDIHGVTRLGMDVAIEYGDAYCFTTTLDSEKKAEAFLETIARIMFEREDAMERAPLNLRLENQQTETTHE